MNSRIITCSVTGSADVVQKNPAVPVSPKQIADSAIAAVKAGAAIVHIHVRDRTTGAPSMDLDLYTEAFNRIKDSGVDVLINLTTGAGARFIPVNENPLLGAKGSTLAAWQKRVEHIVALKPEVCSLDVGSFNFGEHAFINTPSHLREMSAEIMKAGTKPEMEVFELGHIRLAKHLIERNLVSGTPLFQVCLGIPYAAPADVETLIAMKAYLPANANWSAFGIGAQMFPMVAHTALLGGHVRVGLEDSIYIRKGELASDNVSLVKRAVAILESLDLAPASPSEARSILGLQ
jgi:uncharacterized protein (DUF849 family)